MLAYNVSKAALDQFTRCVALELAAKQIRVNSVNPGVIVTELQKRGGLDTERYEKFLEHSKTTHALGRPGEAGEVKFKFLIDRSYQKCVEGCQGHLVPRLRRGQLQHRGESPRGRRQTRHVPEIEHNTIREIK